MKRTVILSLLVCVLGSTGSDGWSRTASTRSGGSAVVESQHISIKQLRRVLFKDLQHRIDPKVVTLNLQVLFPKTPVRVPAGALTLRVEQDRFGNLTGRRAFRVQVNVNANPVKTVSVVAAVTARADVVAPVRWIKMHEVLQANDVKKTTVTLRNLKQNVVWNVQDLIGKQATRSLPPHQPIRPSFVMDPPLIHKGDRVLIEVRRGGLFVQTIGVAQATGHSGELIPVTNQSSGREVLAMIRSIGVVEVQF